MKTINIDEPILQDLQNRYQKSVLNKRIIKVVTSEVEIITRHYTYEVMVDENMTEEFISTMNDLDGNSEIYDELDKYDYKFISRVDGKQYPTDDNDGEISEVELLKQLPLSL